MSLVLNLKSHCHTQGHLGCLLYCLRLCFYKMNLFFSRKYFKECKIWFCLKNKSFPNAKTFKFLYRWYWFTDLFLDDLPSPKSWEQLLCSSSQWDIKHLNVQKKILQLARCFQMFSYLALSVQLVPEQSNWLIEAFYFSSTCWVSGKQI